MKQRILFTGGGGAGTQSLWVNLSKRYEIFFADACKDSIDDLVPESNKVTIPFASSDNFIPALIKIVQDKNIDILVPGVDEELLLIARSKAILKAKILLPSSDFIEKMLDKLVCMQTMQAKGLRVPKTLLISQTQDFCFPHIIKPRSGRGSRGVAIVNSNEEISAYKVFYKTTKDSIISQELAIGTEYTVLIAADSNATLKAIIPVRIEQKKGITIRATAEIQQHIIDYCTLFQEKFKATGIYNLQCILTDKNEVIPFEINPRISTTFCLGVAAGFDPFTILFTDNITTEVFYPDTKYRLKRNWHNHIIEVN